MPESPPQPDPAFYLAGPTGCGKTAVALALARRLGEAEIINGDAFQIYRGIEILSAAPTESERAGVPHHLFGALSMEENCNAIRFVSLARKAIAQVVARDALPIVVGGSGLYLKALTHGIAPAPPRDSELRESLESLSLDELAAWLTALDPKGAALTNLKNRRYVIRNLEITLLTGRPASEVKAQFAVPDPKIRAVFLSRDRSDLHDRIHRRTEQMFEDGVVEEIRGLEDTALSETAERAIGLLDIRALIAGRIDEAEAIATIQQATRRYVKRQQTWFRRENVFQTVCLAPDERPDSAVDRILSLFPDLIPHRT